MTDWYPWYPVLFEGDTMHLDEGQDGVYRRLLDWYMSRRRPLPDNDAALAAIARVPLDRWMERYTDVVRPFFKAQGGALRHKRCDIELDRQDRLERKRGEVAKKGAEARWNKNKEIDACRTQEAMQQAPPLHTNGNAEPMLPDATGQDKTLQDSNLDRSSPLTPRARMFSVDRAWQPGEGVKMWAWHQKWQKPALEAQVEAFKAHSIGHGKSYADVDEAFKSWLIKAPQFGQQGVEKPKGGGAYIP